MAIGTSQTAEVEVPKITAGAKAGIKGTLDPNCPETWIDYPSGFVIL